VSAEVLSQKGNDDLIRSVAYFSKTLSSAECNYGYEPRMSFDSVETEKTIRERIQKRKASDITKKMKDI
jgi:hypothetical protein